MRLDKSHSWRAKTCILAAVSPFRSRVRTNRYVRAQVVLFSYNFGNFRGEISHYSKQTQKFSCVYDRFFFTDLVDVARPLADDGWILFKVSVNDA
mgnify:FL=1